MREVASITPDWANEFQWRCLPRVLAVLEEHGIEASPDWVRDDCVVQLEFSWESRTFEIRISSRDVVMLSEPALYEAYLHSSREKEFGEIEEFAVRLDRFLSEGGWSAPNEKSSWF